MSFKQAGRRHVVADVGDEIFRGWLPAVVRRFFTQGARFQKRICIVDSCGDVFSDPGANPGASINSFARWGPFLFPTSLRRSLAWPSLGGAPYVPQIPPSLAPRSTSDGETSCCALARSTPAGRPGATVRRTGALSSGRAGMADGFAGRHLWQNCSPPAAISWLFCHRTEGVAHAGDA